MHAKAVHTSLVRHVLLARTCVSLDLIEQQRMQRTAVHNCRHYGLQARADVLQLLCCNCYAGASLADAHCGCEHKALQLVL
jgi:hypothetical protein